MKNLEYIQKYFDEMIEVINKFPIQDVNKVMEILFEAWQNDKRVFIMGNGGSASTASHMVCDLSKCTIVSGKIRFTVINLVENLPWISALVNDEGWDNVYVEQLKNYKVNSGDVIIGFSVHGGNGKDKAGLWSQNLLKAMDFVQQNGGKAIGIAGFDGGAMKKMCDACIVVPVDSTPHTESFHLVLEHLISFGLHEMIKNYQRKFEEDKTEVLEEAR